MTEKLKQIIKDEVGRLPEENKETISSFGWERISEEIGKQYLVNDSEINDLQVEVLLVLIGLEDPGLFAQHVENNIGTSTGEAKKIENEVVRKIFIPINDAIAEKIKESEKTKTAKWDQNLNFILSGGNFASFLAPTAEDVRKHVHEGGNDTNKPSLKDKLVI